MCCGLHTFSKLNFVSVGHVCVIDFAAFLQKR